jgi:hypothetical protein
MIRRSLSALALGVFILSAPLAAQDARADIAHGNHPILERLSKIGEKPFECTVDLVFRGEDGEAANGKALLAFADKRHFSFSMTMVGNDGRTGNQTVSFKVVGDGSFLNAEIAAPGMPQKQAFKISMDAVEKIMDSGDAEISGMPNPAAEIQNVLELINFQEVAVNGGKTTRFTATVDPSKFPGGFSGPANDVFELAVDFDTKSGFPLAFNMNSKEGGKLTLKSSNVNFPESISQDRFNYSAPDGTFVMDMTPMVEMQLNAAQQGEL